MAKAKKSTAAAEAAQETREVQEMAQDTQAAAQAAEDSRAAQETIGPEDGSELLGCQDEAELQDGLLLEYAVTAENGLYLRAGPSVDSAALAVLPWGAGVFAEGGGEPEKGWLRVRTGRLAGYMMEQHLEALPLPELGHGAE